MLQDIVYDAWTPMSFKRVMGDRTQPGVNYENPRWVGPDNARRLMAYKVLQAYVDNAARHFLSSTDERVIEQHREYGDGALIRDTILDAVLGDSQEIVVPDAADFDPGGEDGQGATGDQAAWDYQEWIRKQWDAERGALKLLETERDAVGLGDGVYSLHWSGAKKRCRIRVWDPGFYFPVISDGNEDDFPDTVHLAWEVPTDVPNKTRVRRITWQLVTTEDARTYAWNDEAVNLTCLYTDATWELDVAHPDPVNDLSPDAATYEIGEDGEELRDLDLHLDFVPVVHLPNTVAIKNHYGKSSLATVLQILDDLSNADTDAQAASATAAKPVLALEGGTLGRRAPAYNPGEVWELGDGKLNLIDTSKSLDAILKYIEGLLARLSVNARTPDSLLGRVKPSEVPSGLALSLSFGPLAAMVGEMRLSRDEKYPLLLKFLWRINKGAGAPDVPDKYFPAELRMGSYLPQDKQSTVDLIRTLLGQGTDKPAISRKTAVDMLVEAGFSIADANEEVVRIESTDFDGAEALHSATGSTQLVLDYLNLDEPDDLPDQPDTGGQPPVQPTLPLPGVPQPGGEQP